MHVDWQLQWSIRICTTSFIKRSIQKDADTVLLDPQFILIEGSARVNGHYNWNAEQPHWVRVHTRATVAACLWPLCFRSETLDCRRIIFSPIIEIGTPPPSRNVDTRGPVERNLSDLISFFQLCIFWGERGLLVGENKFLLRYSLHPFL